MPTGFYPRVPISERFLAKVQKTSSCWLWTGAKTRDGRGVIGQGKHKTILAPRVSWFVATGQWPPDSLFVCHTCDNPTCVNPDHLFLGTHTDNMQDASRKGRIRGQSLTHCLRGHPLSGDNLGIDKYNHRRCLTCDRESKKRWQDKKRMERKLCQNQQ